MNLFNTKRKKKQKLQDQFWADGYVNLGRVFDDDEVRLMKEVVDSSDEMQARRKIVKEKYDNGSYPSFETIFVMNDVFTDNIFSLACRKPEIIDFISDVFDDDAYLYHSKVPLKYPGMPGFKHHQDYYYWYKNGCIFPNMASCFIALEETTVENGCLKFIPKSHLCGRLEHVEYDGFSDSEADPQRIEILKEQFGEHEVILKPGEVSIHHCNLLHGSEANLSNNSRLALLGCFNTKGNTPVFTDSDHPHYKYQSRFHGKITRDLVDALPDFSVSFRS